jgi:hypothetical protein
LVYISALARREAEIKCAGILDRNISESPSEYVLPPNEEDAAQGIQGDLS